MKGVTPRCAVAGPKSCGQRKKTWREAIPGRGQLIGTKGRCPGVARSKPLLRAGRRQGRRHDLSFAVARPRHKVPPRRPAPPSSAARKRGRAPARVRPSRTGARQRRISPVHQSTRASRRSSQAALECRSVRSPRSSGACRRLTTGLGGMWCARRARPGTPCRMWRASWRRRRAARRAGRASSAALRPWR